MAGSELNSIETIEKLFKHQSLLDSLVEFERFLDNFHLYSYQGWYEGEVVAGPKVERFWIRVVLMFHQLPDPMAGMALIKHGCKVKFKQGHSIDAIKVRTPDDYREDGSKKPKMKKDPVWFIEISVPRRFIDEVDIEDMTMFDDKIETRDVGEAEDQNLESEGFSDDAPVDIGEDDDFEI